MMWPWGRRPDPTEHLTESRQTLAVMSAVVAALDRTIVELKEVTAELKAVTAQQRRGSDDAD